MGAAFAVGFVGAIVGVTAAMTGWIIGSEIRWARAR